MANSALNSKTREDYHIERLGDFAGEEWARENAQKIVERENERMWAHYRDPESDLTQLEARDRSQREEYPERYQVSQSSVSRKLSELDDAMLTEPVRSLRMKERTHEEELAGVVGRGTVDDLKNHFYDELLDAYRESLARLLVDLVALDCFRDGERETPPWARERYRDLDPDLGREFSLDAGYGGDVHDPTTD